MNPGDLFQFNPIINALGWTLMHSIWVIGLIAGFVKLGLWRMRHWAPELQYRLVTLGFIAMIISHVAIFMLLFEPAATIPQVVPELVIPVQEQVQMEERTTQITFFEGDGEDQNIWSFVDRAVPVVTLLWFIGFLFFLVRFGVNLQQLYIIRRTGLTRVDNNMLSLLGDCKRRLGIHQSIQFWWSEKILDPVTIGHFKPMILLPVGMINALTVEEVEMILLHELMHIRRRDFLINVLQTLMEVVFFYHPLVWWMSKTLRTLREHSCDDGAINCCQDPQLYAKTLLHLQKLQLLTTNPLAMQMSKLFTHRIKRLFGYQEQAISTRSKSVVFSIMIVSLLFLYSFTQNLKASYAPLEDHDPVQQLIENLTADTENVSSEVYSFQKPNHAIYRIGNSNIGFDFRSDVVLSDDVWQLGKIDANNNLTNARILLNNVECYSAKADEVDQVLSIRRLDSIRMYVGPKSVEKYGAFGNRGVVSYFLNHDNRPVRKDLSQVVVDKSIPELESKRVFLAIDDPEDIDPNHMIVTPNRIKDLFSKRNRVLQQRPILKNLGSNMGYDLRKVKVNTASWFIGSEMIPFDRAEIWINDRPHQLVSKDKVQSTQEITIDSIYVIEPKFAKRKYGKTFENGLIIFYSSDVPISSKTNNAEERKLGGEDLSKEERTPSRKVYAFDYFESFEPDQVVSHDEILAKWAALQVSEQQIQSREMTPNCLEYEDRGLKEKVCFETKHGVRLVGKITKVTKTKPRRPWFYLNDLPLTTKLTEYYPEKLKGIEADSIVRLIGFEATKRYGWEARGGVWLFYKDYESKEVRNSVGKEQMVEEGGEKKKLTFHVKGKLEVRGDLTKNKMPEDEHLYFLNDKRLKTPEGAEYPPEIADFKGDSAIILIGQEAIDYAGPEGEKGVLLLYDDHHRADDLVEILLPDVVVVGYHPKTSKLTVTPNPAQSRINYGFHLAEESNPYAYIVNVNGQIVMDWELGLLPVGDHQPFKNVSQLPQGTYYLIMDIKGRSLKAPFLITR